MNYIEKITAARKSITDRFTKNQVRNLSTLDTHEDTTKTDNERSLDEELRQITRPYTDLLYALANSLIDEQFAESHGVDIKKKGNKLRASWTRMTNIKAESSQPTTSVYGCDLQFSPFEESVALDEFAINFSNLGEKDKYSLRLGFKNSDIDFLELKWATREQMGPYELIGIGKMPVGNSGIRHLIDSFLPKLTFNLRKDETSDTKVLFNLGSQKKVSIDQTFQSDIGFDRTAFDSKFGGETIDTASTFRYDPLSNVFNRKFLKTSDLQSYGRANRYSGKPLIPQMEAREYLIIVGSILKLANPDLINPERHRDQILHLPQNLA